MQTINKFVCCCRKARWESEQGAVLKWFVKAYIESKKMQMENNVGKFVVGRIEKNKQCTTDKI